ncbi:MAG: hypA [Pedosphaera sp.]|nr:hypA [Pedosphaera sp.]
MHELSIVSALVGSILDYVGQHQVGKVLEVRLSVGELTYFEAEQLRFCYSAVSKSTALENSALEVEQVLACVKCPHCCYEGTPKYWQEAPSVKSLPTLQCPRCGKAAEATQGHECTIKSIKYVS